MLLALKTEKGGQGLRNVGTEIDFPLEPPERMHQCQHLDFKPVSPTSDFYTIEL